MASRRLGWLGVALLSGTGAGLLALTSAMNAAFADGTDATLIMGGTGTPTPDSMYLTDVNTNYILPNIYPATDTTTALTTPEELFPQSGLSQLTFGQSVVQGLGDLQNKIAAEPAGTDTIVFGYSQSATIATDELDEIATGTVKNPPSPADLGFVLIGDPNNPDGGILERLDGVYVPGFNFPLNGATPDLAYPTDIYTIQYDGIADAPQYLLNPLADANAILGYFHEHGNYPTLTPEQVATAIQEPVSPGAAGDTTYYFIPTQTLPLLEPLVQAGAPQWLIDLLNPDLRVLVDLGYGNIGPSFLGIDDGYANLPTPASLFELVNPLTVGSDLIKGAVQGVTAALVSVGVLPQSDMPDTYPFVPSLDPGLSINLGQPGETLISTLAGALGSGLYALNIPDFANGTSDAGDFITDMTSSGFNLADLFGLF